MTTSWFVFLMALAPPAAVAHPSISCERLLASSGLGIGALTVASDGRLRLGLAPYVGSLHRSLVLVLDRRHGVREIRWLGEARYVMTGPSVQFFQANETSGFFKELVESEFSWDGRRLEVKNSVAHLPRSVMAPHFQGIPFDRENMRLVPALNGLRSVRHDIVNALQTAVAFSALIHRATSDDERTRIVSMLQGDIGRSIELANWFVTHLLETNRLEADHIEHVTDILSLTLAADWAGLDARMDRGRLDREMQIIARQANLPPEETPVAVFELTED